MSKTGTEPNAADTQHASAPPSTAERSLLATAATRRQQRNASAIAPGMGLIRRGVLTYICALLLIAGFTVMFHFITDSIVSRQDSTARVVNLSGRQRMLSQRIAKLALERAAHLNLRPDAELTQTLNESINMMATSHQTLLHGSGDGKILPPGPAVDAVYHQAPYMLDAKVNDFIRQASRVAARPADQLTTADPDLLALERASQEPLLTALNAAVTAIQTTSEESIASLRKVLVWLAILMLLVLLAEALWLYRPLFKRLELAQTRLVEIGRTDPLTGCLNRRAFTQEAQRALGAALIAEQPMAVLMTDIDHFKAVNDRFGHPAGDLVINSVVATTLRCTRQGNIVCRMGGEEFAILLRNARLDQALIAAEHLRKAIEAEPVSLGGDSAARIEVTISIGVAVLKPDDDTSIFQLLNRADKALYYAKRSGRNRVTADALDMPAQAPRTTPATVRL